MLEEGRGIVNIILDEYPTFIILDFLAIVACNEYGEIKTSISPIKSSIEDLDAPDEILIPENPNVSTEDLETILIITKEGGKIYLRYFKDKKDALNWIIEKTRELKN